MANRLRWSLVSDVSHILNAIETGDPQAADQLLPLMYAELRRLAAERLANEAPGQTLQPTALVHEVYIRLMKGHPGGAGAVPQQFANRGYFFAAAAEAMRRILIESARRKRGPERGGDKQRVTLTGDESAPVSIPDDMLDLSDALERLADHDPAAAEVARLHLLTGSSVEDAAEVMGIARASAYRHWMYARAWLREALAGQET